MLVTYLGANEQNEFNRQATFAGFEENDVFS